MEKFVFEVEMDSKVKTQVEALYDQLGLPFADAIRVFAHASLMVQGVPFPLICDGAKLRWYLVCFFTEEVVGGRLAKKRFLEVEKLKVGSEWPDEDHEEES